MEHAITASRVLMGDSLGFHIIFVMFGLTLPILVSWFEFTALRKKDPRYLRIAKFWSKIMTVFVVAGIISGIIVALQMTLVWPGILKFGGEVIGLPFMYETYAFLIEAVFLGLYMATWNNKRISPTAHWLFSFGIIIGATLSAFAITSVDAWMNLPTGFTIVGGTFTNIDVIKAMFSETSLVEFVHSMSAYYLATSLAIAGIYLIKLARKKDRASKKYTMDRKIIGRLMIFAVAAFACVVVTADITGKYLAKNEPSKLAALELVEKTDTHVPFILGGIQGADGKVTGPYIKIPDLLSFLVGYSADTKVTGLNSIAKKDQAPLVVHTLFDIKLILIGILSAVIVGYFGLRAIRPKWLYSKAILIALGVASFTGIAIVELGWMLTEIGRQPWAVRGYVTTAEAVTKTHDITSFGYFFPIAYVLLFVVTGFALRNIVHANRKEEIT